MNSASEIRIRAERRMGEMLRDQEMQKPRQYQQASRRERLAPTLKEVGITYSMSSRAQKIASVPEAEFEAVIIVSQIVQKFRVQYRAARAVAAESSL